ncbi:Smr/MutS family protein [Paracoccus aestuariivivens]|uniref:DNA mismatch repair protein MutS n=1 Tax=Paracoccus aestuariivivens TaxID=1820333 RepID=A0A6L6JC29_9RHOB|nr:Smr/MutS family protein [Paracoccus aestuariivivens]MTH78239.1 DNA mismatch repair protein MutS [Paracoccus aestuariivivens]
MARRRGLTAEEKALWSRIAKTAVPMHPGRASKPDIPEEPRSKPARAPRAPDPAPLPLPDFRIGSKPVKKPQLRIDLSPHPGHALREQPVRMDHKTHRRMSQGKLSPEDRIDLHGMTLSVAQPQLTRFILNAQGNGYRLVLVITGKGREGGPDAPLPVRPGALRHNVPLWLEMAPLNQLVLQVRPAHRRHGGDGAYYVYLRR